MNINAGETNLLALPDICKAPFEQVSDFQSEISAKNSRYRGMLVNVRSFTDRMVRVCVDPDDSIANLKEILMDKEGYVPGELLIIYKGKMLQYLH